MATRYFRNSIITRILGILLAANILNISIDPADPTAPQLREDLSINDIESIVELVMEEVLNHADSCEESDDQDTDKTSSPNTLTFIFQESKIEKPRPLTGNEKKSFCGDRGRSVLEPFTSITTPPPKFS